MQKVELQRFYCFLLTYAYTTGTLGAVQSTYTYTYGNAEWGDQLTAYRGTSITYDTLGNPLSYYNGSSYTFTWQKGRTLATATKGGVTSTYIYNADGIRIGKNSGGVVTEYVLNGTLILAEKHGDTVIRYIYDENGLPVVTSMKKNFDLIHQAMTGGKVAAAYTPTYGGVAEAIMKMCFGNDIGFAFDESQSMSDLFGYA